MYTYAVILRKIAIFDRPNDTELDFEDFNSPSTPRSPRVGAVQPKLWQQVEEARKNLSHEDL